MFLFHDCLAGKEEEAGRVRQAGRQGGGAQRVQSIFITIHNI